MPSAGELPTLTFKGKLKHISVYIRQNKYDPTRTTSLRNAFAAQFAKRFKALQRVIVKKIVDDDCFGIADQSYRLTVMSGEFNFVRSAEKVDAFMVWLKQQEALGLLSLGSAQQIGVAVEQSWMNVYLLDSYQRGVERARYELIKAGFGVPSIEASGGILAAMQVPFHIDRVGLVYSRAFSELKGITDSMDKQISQVLSQGMIDGDNPIKIARKLVKTMMGTGDELGVKDTLGRWIPAKRRAEMLARTEIIRAHHAATVQEYKNWGAEGVTVKAEWRTADYDVCPECAGLQGTVFTLAEIETKIPKHPNCRCCALPYKDSFAELIRARDAGEI